MSAMLLLRYCLNVCARVSWAGCVWLQIEFGSGLEGRRSEFSAGFRLHCVICLCWVNQLPSARVKVWLRSKVTNNSGCLIRQGAASVRSAASQTQRHTRRHTQSFVGLIWRVQADRTAGRLPLM